MKNILGYLANIFETFRQASGNIKNDIKKIKSYNHLTVNVQVVPEHPLIFNPLILLTHVEAKQDLT